MSDFDEIFEQKMNEEQSFSGREKSWRGIENRLDAFDAGSAGGGKTSGGTGHWLRFWQAATVAGLLFGGWFLMEKNRLAVENASLKMELSKVEIELLPTAGQANLTEKQSAELAISKKENAAGQAVLTEKESAKSAISKKENAAGQTVLTEKESAKSAISKKGKAAGQAVLAEKESAKSAIFKKENVAGQAVLTEKESAKSAISKKENAAGQTVLTEKESAKSAIFKKENVAGQTVLTEKESAKSAIFKKENVAGQAVLTEKKSAKSAISKKENAAGQAVLTEKESAETGIPKEENIDLPSVLNDEKLKNLQTEVARLSMEKDSIQQLLYEKQTELNLKLAAEQATFAEKLAVEKARFDSLESAATAVVAALPALIQPVKTAARFRLGAEILNGQAMPKDDGISRLGGHGFLAEWNFKRPFSMTAGADFLEYDVESKAFPKKHHFPAPPKPSQNHPDHELTNIETTRAQQNFSLGLKYSLPVGGRFVRPTIGLAHSWVRLPSSFISFKFEDKMGGGGPGPGPDKDPETITQRTDNQWVTNNWRLGLGLEHERSRVVFRLGADYSRSLKKEMPLFDSLIFRGGLAFKF